MRLGVLDVGSNTVHLLVVDAHVGAAPIPATSHKRELRLAEHLDKDGNLTPEIVQDLTSVIIEGLAVAEDLGCTDILAFATSAIREAGNGESVLRDVQSRTGVELQVLGGIDEARLTFLAVRRWFGWSSRRLLVLDIGGGSLEVAGGIDEDPDIAVSVALGAGRMARQFFTSDPVTKEDLKALRKHARTTIAEIVPGVAKFGAPDHAVATSKTFRSLARITGAAPAAEGPFVERILHRDALRLWVPRLAAMTVKQRGSLPGVSPGRAMQVLAGAVVAEAALDLLDLDQVEIGPWALREGIILRKLDQMASAAN
jgi:exopolyphosphatase/guanosine-5'-triphosphate,3'-diphosphate pyrophosphatase